MPIVSTLTMQLVLMVANPWAVTIPMASGLEDASVALPGDSSFFKQAVTPRKLQVGATSRKTSSSHTCKEGFSGVGVFCRVAGLLAGSVWGIHIICSSFSLRSFDRWGICPAATMGHDGCKTFSHSRNLGTLFSPGGSLIGPSLMCTGRHHLHAWGNHFLDQSNECLLWKGQSFEHHFIWEGEVTP